jgi:hypothetical protein
MIPRSYSRDLALQLNFISTQLDDRQNGLKATTDANHGGRIAHLVLFGFADSKDRYSMSFILGIFAFLCRPLHSGSVFSSTSCITATLVFLSTSVG